jgi:hypothetical protein
MQTIYDLNNTETVALTDEEIKSFIDIECAHKGVMLLPPEPIAPEKPQIVSDVTMYEFMGVYFETPEAAASVMEEVSKHQQYTYEYKASTKIFKRENHYAADRVSVEKGMTQETYQKHKAALDKFDSDQSLYNAAKKGYDKAVEARRSIVSSINDYVETARDIVREEDLIRDTMAKYIDLAKGDTKIAYGFLLAAKPNMELEHSHRDLWEELDRMYNPPECVEIAA